MDRQGTAEPGKGCQPLKARPPKPNQHTNTPTTNTHNHNKSTTSLAKKKITPSKMKEGLKIHQG